LNTIFIVIAFTRRILNCISAKKRENHTPVPPVSWPPLTEDPILVAPPESQGSFWLWFLQADIIDNPYSFITHMLLYMHVHFLIITNIHISGIFSKLVSQCASVCVTQLFYNLTYNIHVKVYCYCLTLNCYCPTVVVQPLLLELLLSNDWCPTVAVWTLIRFLTISRVLELHFKWDWSRWKAKTRGYKFSKGRRTQLCLQNSQNCSSTQQSYYPIESVTTQSRLVTYNWSSTSPNWARSVSLVS
jgi:hypothetical protein